jgi:DNA-binding beta-propeller fold protein YncE
MKRLLASMKRATIVLSMVACLVLARSTIAQNLFVANSAADDVTFYAPDGTDLGVFASTGFANPLGMAFDSSGNVYVSNSFGDTIRKFAPDGTDLGDFVQLPDSDPPGGIVFDSSGNLFVGSMSGKIYEVSPDGLTISIFADQGGKQPTYQLAFDPTGNLYTTTGSSPFIQSYQSDGTPLGLFASLPDGVAGTGMVFDALGNLYVSGIGDFAEDDQVHRFSSLGVDLGVFVNAGVSNFNLDGPQGLAFDPSNGNLVVANYFGNFVDAFSSTTGEYITDFTCGCSLNSPTALAFAPVPEPGVAVLGGGLAFGLLGAVVQLKRGRKRF